MDSDSYENVIELTKQNNKWSYMKESVEQKETQDEEKFTMNKNVKSVMSKEELEVVESGTIANVKLQSDASLKKYIKLAKSLRDKYSDIVDRHRGSNRHKPNRDNIEKVHIFGVVLGRFDRQYRKNRAEAECVS